MVDEVDLGARFLETRCDRRLDALRTHILFELDPLLILLVKLVEILFLCLCWCFKVAQRLGVEIANLHGVPHLEVDLVGVEAKSFHRCPAAHFKII